MSDPNYDARLGFDGDYHGEPWPEEFIPRLRPAMYDEDDRAALVAEFRDLPTRLAESASLPVDPDAPAFTLGRLQAATARILSDPDGWRTYWPGMPGPKLVPAELKGYEMRPAPDTSWIQTGREADYLSRLPRWVHRSYAWLLRYFWLPCPLCGRSFGGHEWRDIDGKPSTVDMVGAEEVDGIYHTVIRTTAICPSCTRAGLGDG